MADDPTKGLYSKYYVERRDGKPIDRCIVLELSDPNTWPALRVWAVTVEAAGYRQLAEDTRALIVSAQRARDLDRRALAKLGSDKEDPHG